MYLNILIFTLLTFFGLSDSQLVPFLTPRASRPLFVAAASHPNATGMASTINATTHYFNVNSLTRIQSGNPYNASSPYAYTWNLNVTSIRNVQVSDFESINSSSQVNAVSELVFSQESAARIARDNRTITLLVLDNLPDNLTLAGQNDDGTCAQTLGAECASALNSAFVTQSDNSIPTMPQVCRDRIGRSNYGAGTRTNGVWPTFYNQSLVYNSTNPTPEGYWLEVSSLAYNETEIGIRILNGTSRSVFFSDPSVVTGLENRTLFEQAVWRVRPVVVKESAADGTTGPRWGSITCLRARNIVNGTPSVPTFQEHLNVGAGRQAQWTVLAGCLLLAVAIVV